MKKQTLKKLGAIAVATALTSASVAALAGCGEKTPDTPPAQTPVTYSVDFNTQLSETNKSWEKKTAGNTTYYIVKQVTYCEKPTHASIQSMSIYVPENYLNADGTVNKEGTQGNYTAETAPIIYLNNVSGYSGGAPWEIDSQFRRAGTKYGYNWYYNYLDLGFVLVFVGERGIEQTVKDADGNSVLAGVAPITLVDLKAGVRFLKHNDDVIPGSSDRIISSGVSAGGNCSALLGVSGNTTLFDSYLEAIGAVMDETDDVFASQDYCPITDLDHAALAYEWFWQGDAAPNPNNNNEPAFKITGFNGAISEQLAIQYAQYFNALGLTDEKGNTLQLATDGSRSGSFYEWLVEQYEASYNHFVEVSNDKTDVSKYAWLSYDETDGATIATSSSDYSDVFGEMQALGSRYNIRQKVVMSFDTPDYSGDNGVFGKYLAKKSSGNGVTTRHFTPAMCDALTAIKTEYATEYNDYYQAYYDDTHNEEVLNQINWYSPFYYINNADELGVNISENFRICVGTQDRDTSPTISATLALALQNAGFGVSYNLMWNQIHEDADMAGEFEAWVESLFAE